MSVSRRSSPSDSPRWERTLEAVRGQGQGPVCQEKMLWGAPIVVARGRREVDDGLRHGVEKRRAVREAPIVSRVRRFDRWRRMPDFVEILRVMVVRRDERPVVTPAVVHVRPA